MPFEKCPHLLSDTTRRRRIQKSRGNTQRTAGGRDFLRAKLPATQLCSKGGEFLNKRIQGDEIGRWPRQTTDLCGAVFFSNEIKNEMSCDVEHFWGAIRVPYHRLDNKANLRGLPELLNDGGREARRAGIDTDTRDEPSINRFCFCWQANL